MVWIISFAFLGAAILAGYFGFQSEVPQSVQGLLQLLCMMDAMLFLLTLAIGVGRAWVRKHPPER